MNWGHKIILGYSLFVALVATMITICVKQDDIHLVSKDYYKEEIAYQGQIEKLTNTRNLGQPVRLGYAEAGTARLSLPASQSGAQGQIVFFRPADARQDVKIPLHLDATGSQDISLARLARGLWKVKITWHQSGKDYLSEQTLVVP
ncbi:MAG: FixH family protein [Cytophagales bacterium]|nr:FixH family protein [Cytophagales bacterium]